jgi:hypothetical protein
MQVRPSTFLRLCVTVAKRGGPGEHTMLAEIFMLRLEAALRNADGQLNASSDTRFTPVTLAIKRSSDLKLSPKNGRA